MTEYARITGKVFGSAASASGDDPEIGQFGSALAGEYNGTSDVATIQALPAWRDGFIGAVTPNTQFPPLPEMTGFGKVLSYQICYLLQHGVAGYDSGTTYYTGNWVSYNSSLYVAKVDNFSNVAPTNTTYWSKFTGGSSRNLGEYVTSALPLTDTTLHLADGSLLSQTNYPEFYNYVGSLYSAPTVTQYYAWQNEDNSSDIIYTLSSTPNVNDNTYRKVIDTMESYEAIRHVGANSIRTQDETRYVRSSTNDTTISTFSQSYFTTEEDWQYCYTTYGECGKFVYNSSANTVRIPLVNSYFTNTSSTTNVGILTPASLPNIKGSVKHLLVQDSSTNFSWQGAFYNAGIGDNTYRPSSITNVGDNYDNIGLDASRYNAIYSDSATTVNTQSIKQLVYIVVKK